MAENQQQRSSTSKERMVRVTVHWVDQSRRAQTRRRESAAAEQHEQRGNGQSDSALGGSIQKGSNEARIKNEVRI